jgi:hypothetical protein
VRLRNYIDPLPEDLPEPRALGGGTTVVQRAAEIGRKGEAATEAKAPLSRERLG